MERTVHFDNIVPDPKAISLWFSFRERNPITVDGNIITVKKDDITILRMTIGVAVNESPTDDEHDVCHVVDVFAPNGKSLDLACRMLYVHKRIVSFYDEWDGERLFPTPLVKGSPSYEKSYLLQAGGVNPERKEWKSEPPSKKQLDVIDKNKTFISSRMRQVAMGFDVQSFTGWSLNPGTKGEASLILNNMYKYFDNRDEFDCYELHLVKQAAQLSHVLAVCQDINQIKERKLL